MRKKIISLVAAAALVGSVGIISNAQAGTISLKGDTTATLYGITWLYGGWGSQLGGSSVWSTDTSYKVHNGTGAAADQINKTSFNMTANMSRFGFVLHNKAENIMAKIEGDFAPGRFRLRKAYVRHFFANGMNLTLGQDSDVVIENTFSAAWSSPAGFDGSSRGPEAKLAGKFGLGGACVNFALMAGNQNYTDNVNRRVIPTLGMNLSFNFDTGIGSPASVYGFGLIEPIELNNPATGKETAKSPYGYGAGIVLPVSMFTLQSEYVHGYGMNGLAGVAGNGGVSSPASYTNNGTTLITRKFNAYNVEGKVSPLPYMSVAAGWDFIEFKNSTDSDYFSTGEVKRVTTIFANATFKTSDRKSVV